MELSKLYDQKEPKFSFEVFPPKTDEGIDNLIGELNKLKKFDPAFISVTYGAGGSTQGRSVKVIKRILNEVKVTPLPHFTCIGSNESSILDFVKVIEGLGIKNILALKGDPPKDQADYSPENNIFNYANELIAFLKQNTKLEIAAAGYPEVHPKALSLDDDLDHLKLKVEAGAEVVISQLFYDNNYFYNFVERARQKGITIPIIPGILPLYIPSQIEKIIELSGTHLPEDFKRALNDSQDNLEEFKKIAVDYSVKQAKELLEFGVPGIHFYPLNKAEAVEKVLLRLK
jgi:methylenetetrahydrofolate reductase (NADH)